MGEMNARIHIHRHRLCCHRVIQLVMSLFLLNLSGSIQPRYFTAEGGAIPGLVHSNPKEEGRAAVESSLIGSRPPSCDGRCRGCLRCVVVQVPVSPHSESHSVLAYAKGYDISNYKPMTWKCKCGNVFFNP